MTMFNDNDTGGEESVNVRIKETERHYGDYGDAARTIPIAGVTVSRKPAAIVGIVLTIAVGYAFVEGIDVLRGDLTESVRISLTQSGAQPAQVTVYPDQEIVWSNETQEAHILHSDTLCTAAGSCLHTDPIGPGQTFAYAVDDLTDSGEYSYRSVNDPDLSGTVVIERTQVKDGFTFLDVFTGEEELVTDDTPDANASTETAIDEPTTRVAASVTELPQNPNTGIDATNPVEEAREANVRSGAPEQGKGKGKPFAQPETGPGVWAIGLLSLLCMYFAFKKMMANETHSV